jgi:hypothetical protein
MLDGEGMDWVGGRAEGIDSERMGRMRHADGPCAARGWGGLCGRGERLADGAVCAGEGNGAGASAEGRRGHGCGLHYRINN